MTNPENPDRVAPSRSPRPPDVYAWLFTSNSLFLAGGLATLLHQRLVALTASMLSLLIAMIGFARHLWSRRAR